MSPPRLPASCCMRQNVCHNSKRQTTRFLSTTTSTHHPQIKPESPNFIHVPKAPQPDALYQPHIKGVLPVPRPIFPPKTDPSRKTTQDYFWATAPPPSPRSLSAPKPTDPSTRRYVLWKSKLAEHRRRNLRESLQELRSRKERTDRRLAALNASQQSEREALLSAPTPADEKFTSPSIVQTSLPSRSGLPDPDRTARIEAKKRNYATHAAFKKAERRNALHTLYMNARDFIVTEEKLQEAVERAFDPRSGQFDTDAKRGLNIWNLEYPDTVKEMLERVNRAEGGKAVERFAGYGAVTDERMRRLGEELTGGKM
ncbi:MAG: hypothetical protein LQ343_001236 [Gyalolechia ehrenbergii]|nr:MAG: hypothetical protein LQ343_001236 [Gyalolechia ehrenbergii]